MLSGKPLFPGRDYHHQLTLILDVLGTPTLDEFYAITTRRSRDYIRALPFRKKRPFSQIFPNASQLAVDFLAKTLVSCRCLVTILFYVWSFVCCVDIWPEEADYSGRRIGSPISRSLREFIDFWYTMILTHSCLAWSWWWACCTPTWSRVFRVWLWVPLGALHHYQSLIVVFLFSSAQRWHKSGAAQRAAVRRNHDIHTNDKWFMRYHPYHTHLSMWVSLLGSIAGNVW